jgi:hypothetical protein
MRITGIDPGETIGWTALDIDPAMCRDGGSGGARGTVDPPRYLESGTWTPAEAMRVAWREGDVLAIERPSRVHPALLAGGPAKASGVVAGLLAAAWVGGELAGRARAAGARVVEVDAAEARRALGVVIGGSRRGPPCPACSGSGAGAEGLQPGVPMTLEAACDEVARAQSRAAELLAANGRHARGKRTRLRELAQIRLASCARYPCELCAGSGEQRPPSVDQQVAALVREKIAGWPKVSNVHQRDAGVAAAWAALRAL